MQQHLYLTKYIKRKVREARMPEDDGYDTAPSVPGRSAPPAKEMAGNELLAFLGA